LIVEDNDVEREGLSAVLRQSGFGTWEAENGAQAIDCLRAHKPDVIILDMLLSRGDDDGWNVLAQVKNHDEWASIPVIIVTGLGVASPEWARSLGAHAVVRKPVNTQELIAAIQAIAN
jgi:CheY-like chemotaxis protein